MKATGTTELALTFGPKGGVSGCELVGTSGREELDDATCRILRARPRRKFENGSADVTIAERVTKKMKWSLPGLTIAPPIPATPEQIAAFVARNPQKR